MLMKTTTVALGSHFDEFIQASVLGGRYTNASEVIRAGLRKLEEDERKIAALRSAIEEGEDANDNPAWILTVAASVTTSGTTTDLELPTTINGAITLTQAGTLAGLATATPTTTGFTATVDETVTVTVPKTQAAAAFMKVGVGIAPAANNAQQE